jgi:hypothetical protein
MGKRNGVENEEGVCPWVSIEHVRIGNVIELRAEAPFVVKNIGDFDSGAEIDGESQIFSVAMVVKSWSEGGG